MPIVTLTSDFGLSDYYAAIIKGAMLCKNKELNIIDISHNVNPYDIVQGAFILKNAYSSFPEGTIHILSVNNFYAEKPVFLAIRHNGHYFIGPDNGIFSLVFDEIPKDIYELKYSARNSFPLKNVFADTVGHLINEMPFNEIGILVDEIEQRISFQPIISSTQIRGAVIHVDHYENAVVNISRDLFEKVSKKRPFQISFKRHDPLMRICPNYQSVPVGETLAIFNSADYLEIAINMGKAASMLDLRLDEIIQIDFE